MSLLQSPSLRFLIQTLSSMLRFRKTGAGFTGIIALVNLQVKENNTYSIQNLEMHLQDPTDFSLRQPPVFETG
jgi:hypothetical protein